MVVQSSERRAESTFFGSSPLRTGCKLGKKPMCPNLAYRFPGCPCHHSLSMGPKPKFVSSRSSNLMTLLNTYWLPKTFYTQDLTKPAKKLQSPEEPRSCITKAAAHIPVWESPLAQWVERPES